MTFKLKIGNFIEAPIRLLVRDGGRDVLFAFTLVLRRLARADAMALGARVDAIKGGDVQPDELADFIRAELVDIIHDWRDQRLVLDADDKPAPYSAEALDALLELHGAGVLLLSAALGALDKGLRAEDKDKRGN